MATIQPYSPFHPDHSVATASHPAYHTVEPSIEHHESSPGSRSTLRDRSDSYLKAKYYLDPNIPSDVVSVQRQDAPTSPAAQFRQESHAPLATGPLSTPHTHDLSWQPNTPSTSPSQFDMLPPPNSTHPSWQALHNYAQTHASAHGYALSINTTAKNRSRIKLACVCYGSPKNTHKLTPETRVRKNRVSYKTGCRMWIEGKKQEDGSWVLRVGEPNHNHPGRAVEGWALQRKRTWGVQGGRIGVGGVTAKEEKVRSGAVENEQDVDDEDAQANIDVPPEHRKTNHSLESGGLVWKIVEQEMLRKGTGHGRDRGVGRTVKVLEKRLPGIHIFKRDVYNIRAQIKRARKAAGQQLGEGLDDIDNEGSEVPDGEEGPDTQGAQLVREAGHKSFPEIDPMLVAQCNDALRNVTQQEESEVARLRRENAELQHALARRMKELEEKDGEIESLRVQIELANLALYNERGGHAQ